MTTATVPAAGWRRNLTLIRHLAARDIAQANRFSFIGAGWPLLRQIAQLLVLVIAFSAVLDLGIPNYPVFVFSGLIGWSWFVAGLTRGTESVLSGRPFVLRAGFPTAVLPVAALAVPLVDVLYALPVLIGMVIFSEGLEWQLLLLIPLFALQGMLMVGMTWITASLSVRYRDVPQIVGVVLLMAFYLTPVYFDVSRVPEQYQWVLFLNPMAVLLEADRYALIGTAPPPTYALVGVFVLALVLCAIGHRVFAKFATTFVDDL